VGKRSLGLSLLPHVEANHGLFVSGYFTSVVRPITGSGQRRLQLDRPLRAFWEAFNLIFNKVTDSAQVQALKLAIRQEFQDSDDVENLKEMMESIRPWLEDAPDTDPPMAAKTIAVPLFVKPTSLLNKGSEILLARFMRAVLTCIPNLVLCVEHLELADQLSVDLLEKLIREPLQGMLVVITLRDDVEAPVHVAKFICQRTRIMLDQSPHTVHTLSERRFPSIQVTNLSRDDIYCWTADRFGWEAPSEDVLHALADLVYDKSSGNPQFALCILDRLQQKDVECELCDRVLDCQRESIPGTIDEMYASVLNQRDSNTQSFEETAAALGECIGGNILDEITLELVLRCPLADPMARAEQSGFFVRCQDGRLRFASATLRQMAYSRIPESRRALLHLKIGRRLWKSASTSGDLTANSRLFLGAQNIQLGVDLVKDTGESDAIINTSIQAGKQAMQSSAFSLAAFYFELAISALGDRSWHAECYDITLSLYNGCSEAYYCSTDFEAMELKCNAVFHHAKTFLDRLQAYTTLVYANSARHRLDDALNMAFHVLREVGEPFPTDPSLVRVMLEYYKIRRLLHGKTDRFLLSLPESTSIEKATAMRMMSFMSFTAYVMKPNLALSIVFRILRLTLEHGITGPSVLAFAAYGYILGVHMGSAAEGARFARLALKFLEQGEGFSPWLPRIYANLHIVLIRSVPFHEHLESLLMAHQLALKTGDIDATIFLAMALAPIWFHIGKPLKLVDKELRSRIKMMDYMGHKAGLLYQVPIWHVACDLMGREPYPLDLSGDVKDAETACRIAEAEHNKMALEHFYWYRAMYHCLLGEFQKSLDMAKKSREMHTNAEVWLTFFEGISSLALARSSVGWAQQSMVATGRRAAKYMKRLSGTSNFAAKESLLAAEIATLEGKTVRALACFDDAIKFARTEGFLLEKSLAYDRLAEYHRFLGSGQQALPFFECARDAYHQWGAQRLVIEMEKKLALL
jgi:predicted ATPase